MGLTILPGGDNRLFEALVQFFTEDDWNFERVEGEPALRMGFRGKNATWRCFARADEERDLIVFYSIIESLVAEDKRLLVAEYLTRANYGLFLGNFELDFSDGEVRFKTSIGIEDGAVTMPMIRRLVYTNLLMMDQYFPGLMAVEYGGSTPAEALAKVESQD